MALTQIPQETTIETATSPTVTPAKTIACMNTTTANTLMYVVPAGRKFEGVVGVASGSAVMGIVTAGANYSSATNANLLNQTKVPFPANTWGNWNFQFKLQAGDKIYGATANNTSSRILGVEEDA